MDLVTFLLARIGEDEEAAQNMLRWGRDSNYYRHPGVGFDRWTVRRHEENVLIEAHLGIFRPSMVLCVHYLDGGLADYIARHDPARVLAECASKRRIVERAQAMEYAGVVLIGTQMAGILADLALPYAAHSDYQPEWLPEETAHQ